MVANGTTTAEVKTGYGLDTEAELRILEAMLRLDDEGPMELSPTFLGAHAIPAEYSACADEYTDLVCDEMLPAVKDWWESNGAGRPLPFVDL
jgi:imidazolonepropionase